MSKQKTTFSGGLVFVAIIALICVVAITAIFFGRNFYGEVSRDRVLIESRQEPDTSTVGTP